MKSFLIKFFYFFGIPFVLLVSLYIASDPFRTLKKFSLQDFSITNRDYLSMELYLKNKDQQHYNSFIFGSSRGCGINTYQWKSYLPEGSRQFLFQAWSETITGIYQKIKYLDDHDVHINNAIILVDIPNTFVRTQQPATALAIKHYLLSGKSRLYYQSIFFWSYLKPSEIFQSAKELFVKPPPTTVNFDSISNDWNRFNKDTWMIKPRQDSAANKSEFYNIDKASPGACLRPTYYP